MIKGLLAKKLLSTALIYLLSSYSAAFSFHETPACDATHENPCLVLDTESRTLPPANLRDTRMISDYYQGNLTGIERLHASASATPSEAGWDIIAEYIFQRTGNKPQDVLVLDLRQENHGYLNGNALTLCDLHNWLNLGKTEAESLLSEQQWLAKLSTLPQIEHVLSNQQFAKMDYDQGKTIPVEKISSEKELVNNLGFSYQRLTVTDHRAPLDTEVDAFVALIDNLPENTWLHIHCRAGKGRTTTFLSLYDMLKNADKVSFNDIIQRHAAIPPYYDLTDVSRDKPDLAIYYQERYELLTAFYQYAQDKLSGYPGKWSSWKAEHA